MRMMDRKSTQVDPEELEEASSGQEEEGYVRKPLLTAGKAAKYLGISRGTLYRLVEFGEIRAVKSGHAMLIEKESLDEFRTSGKQT
jgi:excisionase family DNA binding protein